MSGRRLPVAILALGIAAFAIGSTEFTIIGLLPQVAAGVHVSIPRAGLLISGYALGVLLGAPLLTAAGTRVPRHRLLLALMAIFTVGNVLSAVAPNYGLLLASRVSARSLTARSSASAPSSPPSSLAPNSATKRSPRCSPDSRSQTSSACRSERCSVSSLGGAPRSGQSRPSA